MSVSMSSGDGAALAGGGEQLTAGPVTAWEEVAGVYQLDSCAAWIRERSLAKVSLQFPDALLGDAAAVTRQLASLCADSGRDVQLFILGDTTYGECCVDEIAAEHISSDGVIHFGHTCLTATCRLPALWIFTRKSCDVTSLSSALEDKAREAPDTCPLVLVYDVEYDHLLSNLTLDNVPLVVGRCSSSNEDICDDSKVRKFGRTFDVKSEDELKNRVVIYVGKGESSLLNFMYNWPENEFHVFDDGSLVPANISVSKFMMKRYFLVEKTKDAERVGLLVGTLGTHRYADIIERLRATGRRASKKVYVFLVGKPNVAKLANFPEIDVFVLVACPETSLVDSRDFLQPIVTPYEFELACSRSVEWAGKLVTDFKELLLASSDNVDDGGGGGDQEEEDSEGDVSLITGKVRSSARTQETVSGGQLTVINDKTIR